MSVKPFGVFVERRPILRPEVELTEELREEYRDRARLASHRAMIKSDPVGEILKCTYFVENRPFPMQYMGRPVSVTRYYPEKNVAVDLFEKIGRMEKKEILFKSKAFKKSGVAYAALTLLDELAELVYQVGRKLCR